MLVWLSAMWALHWGCVVGIVGLAGAVLLMSNQQRIYTKERRRDRRIREELEAYARLDARLRGENDIRELAKRVCRLVAKKSAFQRVAMLVQDIEGRMYVAGSVGMEESVTNALHAWGERISEEETDGGNQGNSGAGVRVGEKSFAVVLGKESAEVGCGRAIMVPVWTTGGRMAGTLAVCADRLMTMQRRAVEEAIPPLEALAVKLGRAMEDAEAAVTESLLRAEKLTGLGALASGVAHALNNPLTAVLGFAELIAETTNETRVRADAKMIGQEARRIRETLRNLLNFGRIERQIDEPVEIAGLVRELAAECEEKLDSRGVRLIVQAEDDIPAVRGNGDGLRQVLEHLLNNAAQAIASVDEDGEDAEREHEIRLSVSRDAGSVQVMVSDTGPGFKEPGRVFDSLHTARQAVEGAGVGLSICYGVVREHGGEINAFNLHPYGAAVVVELPFGEDLSQNFTGAAREVA
ncbi:MAG: HAMP domain-containing sensor histidine kinase [Edaphobacter sp.]